MTIPSGHPSIGIYIQKLRTFPHAYPKLPFKKHAWDAGWDLFTSREQTVSAKSARDIHTDIAIAIPEGWYAKLTSRSSTLRRYGLLVSDAVIDHGYRGEVFIQAFNVSPRLVRLSPGIRIAQLLFLPVPGVRWQETMSLPWSDRGEGGFGSTGD